MRTLTLALALLLTGCSMSPSAEFIEALGKDPATVSIQVNTIYGTVRYCRTAIVNGGVTCDSNGISVKSESATVGVPLTITPQLSIGAPTLMQPAPVQVAPPGPRSEIPSRSGSEAQRSPDGGIRAGNYRAATPAPFPNFADWLAQPPDTARELLRDVPK